MAAGYKVGIHNNSSGNVTVARATGGDTINGAAKNIVLPAGQRANFRVNAAANGYLIENATGGLFLDPTDPSKQAKWDLSGVTTGTVITLTPPAAGGTLITSSSLTGANGAGLVVIQSQSISNQAAVSFTSGINSTYDHYILDCTKVIPQTDNTAFNLFVSTNGGSSYLSTNEYSFSRETNDSSPAAVAEGTGATTQFTIKGGLGNSTGENLNCQIHLWNLSDTAVYKGATVSGVIYDQTPSHLSFHGGCTFFTTSAINAIQVKQGSGNINGTFTLYGVKKV